MLAREASLPSEWPVGVAPSLEELAVAAEVAKRRA